MMKNSLMFFVGTQVPQRLAENEELIAIKLVIDGDIDRVVNNSINW